MCNRDKSNPVDVDPQQPQVDCGTFGAETGSAGLRSRTRLVVYEARLHRLNEEVSKLENAIKLLRSNPGLAAFVDQIEDVY
jgi:hypothetical protein